MRPGVTGLWQVLRSPEDRRGFHEWIEFDIEYVRSAGWRMDMWIFWKTALLLSGQSIRKVLRGLTNILRPVRSIDGSDKVSEVVVSPEGSGGNAVAASAASARRGRTRAGHPRTGRIEAVPEGVTADAG